MIEPVQIKVDTVKQARELYKFCKAHDIKIHPFHYYRFEESKRFAIDRHGHFVQLDRPHPHFKHVNIKGFIELILRYKNSE